MPQSSLLPSPTPLPLPLKILNLSVPPFFAPPIPCRGIVEGENSGVEFSLLTLSLHSAPGEQTCSQFEICTLEKKIGPLNI